MTGCSASLLAAATAVLLAGCASEPLVMRLAGTAAELSGVFPPAETQEVPRYRYLGQLVGESNFRPVDGERRGTARKVLAWWWDWMKRKSSRWCCSARRTGSWTRPAASS